MDAKLYFKKVENIKKPALWQSSKRFVIDNSLDISFGIIRSTHKKQTNTNHIWYIKFTLNKNKEYTHKFDKDFGTLDEKIQQLLKELDVKQYKLNLYFFAINSIILKILLTQFKDDEKNKTIDVANIKNSFESKVITNVLIEKILNDENQLQTFVNNNDIASLDNIKNKFDRTIFKKLIDEYKKKLNDYNADENNWQEFFTKNEKILSFLSPFPIIFLQDKAYIGGKALDNYGGNLADYIYKNSLTNNSCIFEIKTPKTPLIMDSTYRDDIHYLSNELVGGISQIIGYKESFTKQFNSIKLSDPAASNYECLNIKTILLIGKICSI